MNTSLPRFRLFRRSFLLSWGGAVALALNLGPVVFAAPPEGSPAPAAAAVNPVGQQQASAGELVGTMRRAAGMVARSQSANAAENAFRTAKARAFALTLGTAVERLDELNEALKTPDAKTFEAMARTGSALAALQVTFRYNGIEDDEIEEGFEKLAAAYGVFRRNFGRDLVAARTEAESALSPAQKTAREDFQKRGAALAKALTALQPAFKETPAAAFEVGAMLKTLARLDRVPRDRRAVLDQLSSAELLLGRRLGLGVYLGENFPDQAKRLAEVQSEFAAYQEAFQRTLNAAFAEEKPAGVFARPAAYFEDLSVPDVTDADVPALLAGAKKVAETAEKGAKPPDPAALRAADAQINADDPDDDTSLDPADDEETLASPTGANG